MERALDDHGLLLSIMSNFTQHTEHSENIQQKKLACDMQRFKNNKTVAYRARDSAKSCLLNINNPGSFSQAITAMIIHKFLLCCKQRLSF
jgi:hypothetical protein